MGPFGGNDDSSVMKLTCTRILTLLELSNMVVSCGEGGIAWGWTSTKIVTINWGCHLKALPKKFGKGLLCWSMERPGGQRKIRQSTNGGMVVAVHANSRQERNCCGSQLELVSWSNEETPDEKRCLDQLPLEMDMLTNWDLAGTKFVLPWNGEIL